MVEYPKDINFEKDQEEVLDRTENLTSLADQVKKLRDLEDQLKIDEESLKNKKRETEKISGEIIPTLLGEMGLSSLKLADGSAVEVKPYYAANISIKNREAAYNGGKTYDYYVKNWGTENTKETETGRTVVKEYGTTVDGKEDKEDFEIILDDGTGFKNI